MGVTIFNKKHSIDMGCGGFYRLRRKVAQLAGDDIGELYSQLLLDFGGDTLYAEHDKKVEELAQKYNGEKNDILDFLYESDCSGTMNVQHCKSIYEVIKDYDDDVLYGYGGRPDCAKFKDFKQIVQECVENNTPMEWY